MGVPKEHLERNFYPAEDNLRSAIEGPKHEWAQALPQTYDKTEKVEVDSDQETTEELHNSTKKAISQIKGNKELEFLTNCPHRFSSFINAHVIQNILHKQSNIKEAVANAIEVAVKKGLPQLQEEAMKFRNQTQGRNGLSESRPDEVQFSISREKGEFWETQAQLGEYSWEVRGYGDLLSWAQVSPDLKGELDSVSIERNQCMILHLAAGIINSQEGSAKGNQFKQISTLGGEIRSEIYSQAKQCFEALGELEGDVPIIRAELRAHAHDACKRHHDKDNRILLCFPPESIQNFELCMINVAPSLRFTTHLYHREGRRGNPWISPISYRNHMRLAVAPSPEAQDQLLRAPTSVSALLGWESLLSRDRDNATIQVKALTRFPICQETQIRFPMGIQGTMVGKAAIKSIRELMEFEIQEPRTEEKARELGDDALEEWKEEQNSPELDSRRSFQFKPART